MTAILITGAGSGIGCALATHCAEQGDLVYAGVRHLDKLSSSLTHSNIHPLILDVTSETDIIAAVGEMKQHFGLPNILINNAGINRSGTIEECDKETWQEIFNVNFFAPMRLCQMLLPSMRHSGRGCIIMISSLSAEIGLPFDGPYAASKAALNRAAECLASEVAPFGVRIIVAAPGAVRTNLNDHSVTVRNLLTDYGPLNRHMRETAPSNKGDDPCDIAREIRALIHNPVTPLINPVGSQAGKISKMIAEASPQERQDIIHDASGLGWWITDNKGKKI